MHDVDIHVHVYGRCNINPILQAEHVLINGRLEPGILVRLNALQRVTPVSPVLLPHCMDTDNVDMAARHRLEKFDKINSQSFF